MSTRCCAAARLRQFELVTASPGRVRRRRGKVKGRSSKRSPFGTERVSTNTKESEADAVKLHLSMSGDPIQFSEENAVEQCDSASDTSSRSPSVRSSASTEVGSAASTQRRPRASSCAIPSQPGPCPSSASSSESSDEEHLDAEAVEVECEDRQRLCSQAHDDGCADSESCDVGTPHYSSIVVQTCGGELVSSGLSRDELQNVTTLMSSSCSDHNDLVGMSADMGPLPDMRTQLDADSGQPGNAHVSSRPQVREVPDANVNKVKRLSLTVLPLLLGSDGSHSTKIAWANNIRSARHISPCQKTSKHILLRTARAGLRALSPSLQRQERLHVEPDGIPVKLLLPGLRRPRRLSPPAVPSLMGMPVPSTFTRYDTALSSPGRISNRGEMEGIAGLGIVSARLSSMTRRPSCWNC